jgi:DNA-binding NarL/FixJ family response regulator
MSEKERYSVLLVDDHQMMRLGLKSMIQVDASLPIDILEASNLGDAIDMFGKTPDIDLVLLDMNLPDSRGLQSLQRFRSSCPTARVAIFSATEDEFVVRQAIALGAIGFVPKSAQASVSLHLVEALLRGNNLEPSAVEKKSGTQSIRARAEKLSAKQLKVLELILSGMSNQEIASECNIALGTVKNTVSTILLELDVTSRSHLISVFR